MNTSVNKFRMKRLKQCSLLIGLMTAAVAPSQAASLSFYMSDSNRLPDDINYLLVNLTDNLTGGVDIMAETLEPLNDIATKHFGIQRFAFNFNDGTTANVMGLSDGWKIKSDRPMNEFGKFDTILANQSKMRTNAISFTVNNASIDDFGTLFSARVAGLDADLNRCDIPAKAFFAGSTENGFTPVPVPANFSHPVGSPEERRFPVNTTVCAIYYSPLHSYKHYERSCLFFMVSYPSLI